MNEPKKRSYAAGRFAFGIDGSFAGYVKKVSGGNIKGEIGEHNLGTSAQQKKHISNIKHEPLTMEIGMGMGKELWDWIKASWDKGFVPKDTELKSNDLDAGQIKRHFQDSYIRKTQIPACDTSKPEPGYLTIQLDPRIIRYEDGRENPFPGDAEDDRKKWLCSNFQLEIDGLPCERIAKIDSFTWEQKVVEDDVGKHRDSQEEAASLQIPNLKLSIDMQDFRQWFDWFKFMVIDQHSSERGEKNGTLSFLASDQKEELATINFSHLGIMSLEQEAVEANAEEVARFTVELYCESMRFDKVPSDR